MFAGLMTVGYGGITPNQSLEGANPEIAVAPV